MTNQMKLIGQRITDLREVVLNNNGASISIGADENNPSIEFILQDSPYRLVIDNDEITIYNGTNPISYWRKDEFTATKLNLGNFAFIPRANGSLGFRKVN